MTKKIKFYSDRPDLDLLKPIPASRVIPEWYRKMPGVIGGVDTIKKCIPFLDAFTSGYIIPLPMDVIYHNESKQFVTQSSMKINSDHMKTQTEFIQLPEEYDDQPHKWMNNWLIKTPKGYSTLFIHPANREDLPFKSIMGIVDTDKHPVLINFPFFIKKDFNGIIPAGTPMIQAIPFKREEWSSVINDTDGIPKFFGGADNLNPPFNWYKRKWWTKKVFK